HQNIKKTNPSRSSPPSIYKQIIVTFKNEDITHDIFHNKNIWSLHIQEFAARILPVDTESPEFKNRTKFTYKLSGLPINCRYRDLEPILTHKLKAKTCVIDFTKNFGCTTAYVNVDEKDFDAEKYISWNIFKTKIYCTTTTKNIVTCNGCGSPTHGTNDCNNVRPSRSGKGHFYISTKYIERNNGIKLINKSLTYNNRSPKDQMDITDNDTSKIANDRFIKLNILFNNTSNITYGEDLILNKSTNEPKQRT